MCVAAQSSRQVAMAGRLMVAGGLGEIHRTPSRSGHEADHCTLDQAASELGRPSIDEAIWRPAACTKVEGIGSRSLRRCLMGTSTYS